MFMIATRAELPRHAQRVDRRRAERGGSAPFTATHGHHATPCVVFLGITQSKTWIQTVLLFVATGVAKAFSRPRNQTQFMRLHQMWVCWDNADAETIRTTFRGGH